MIKFHTCTRCECIQRSNRVVMSVQPYWLTFNHTWKRKNNTRWYVFQKSNWREHFISSVFSNYFILELILCIFRWTKTGSFVKNGLDRPQGLPIIGLAKLLVFRLRYLPFLFSFFAGRILRINFSIASNTCHCCSWTKRRYREDYSQQNILLDACTNAGSYHHVNGKAQTLRQCLEYLM